METVWGPNVMRIPNWASQLAQLTKIGWSDDNGKCYFPYMPLTTKAFWLDQVKKDIEAARMTPFVLVNNGIILAHVALVWKEKGYECGRWVAYPTAPRGAVTKLVEEAMYYAECCQIDVWVECTQVHTASQKICVRNNLRFAGIGFLDEIDGVNWDIIYFDNTELPNFQPQCGVLANPLGEDIACKDTDLDRLRTISQIMSVERGGVLPPTKFYILPSLKETVRKIISSNL